MSPDGLMLVVILGAGSLCILLFTLFAGLVVFHQPSPVLRWTVRCAVCELRPAVVEGKCATCESQDGWR